MAVGLFIYDVDGTERFGPNTANSTILGVYTTGKNNGSITDPRFARGTPFIADVCATAGTSFTVPNVVIVGNTLSWAFYTDGANWNQPVRIVYGYHA